MINVSYYILLLNSQIPEVPRHRFNNHSQERNEKDLAMGGELDSKVPFNAKVQDINKTRGKIFIVVSPSPPGTFSYLYKGHMGSL